MAQPPKEVPHTPNPVVRSGSTTIHPHQLVLVVQPAPANPNNDPYDIARNSRRARDAFAAGRQRNNNAGIGVF